MTVQPEFCHQNGIQIVLWPCISVAHVSFLFSEFMFLFILQIVSVELDSMEGSDFRAWSSYYMGPIIKVIKFITISCKILFLTKIHPVQAPFQESVCSVWLRKLQAILCSLDKGISTIK